MLSFSVVTPSLNEESFIERTIRSVLEQDDEHLEHIVVDGGSQDETLEIIQRYKDRVQWLSESDDGPTHAINKGIALATGDIVGWLNADAVYTAGAIRVVRQYLEDNPDVDVVYGDGNYIDDDGTVMGPYRSKDWKARRLRRRCFLCQPATFLRREVLERFGVLDQQYRYCADYELWVRLAEQGVRFGRLERLLAGVRLHTGQLVMGTMKSENSIEAIGELRETLKIMANRYGRASTRWTINYGQVAAGRLERSRATKRYDQTVLRYAMQAERQWNHRTWSMAPTVVSLMARHTYNEIKAVNGNPQFATRFVPSVPQPDTGNYRNGNIRSRIENHIGNQIDRVGKFLREHWRSKIFKLWHHEPRNMQLSPAYYQTKVPDKPPVISLVTPTLNQGEYLERTIQSVLEQQYPKLEYIIQDGGSDDQTVEIIRKYEDRLAHWQSAPDRGQSHAINLGMHHATGDILAYLNSDDLLLPGTLAYVARYFQRHPNIDVVYGHRILINEDDRQIGRWILPHHDDRFLAWADYIPQETMFWRRRAWDSVSAQIDETFQFAMDWDLILRFRSAGMKFARLPRFMGAFRVMDDQKTVRLLHTVGRTEMERIRERCLGYIPSRRELRRVSRPYIRRHWVFDKLYSLGIVSY